MQAIRSLICRLFCISVISRLWRRARRWLGFAKVKEELPVVHPAAERNGAGTRSKRQNTIAEDESTDWGSWDNSEPLTLVVENSQAPHDRPPASHAAELSTDNASSQSQSMLSNSSVQGAWRPVSSAESKRTAGGTTAEMPEEPDVDFFQGMEPVIQKARRVVVRPKNASSTNESGPISNRFRMAEPAASSELGVWDEGSSSAWDDSTLDDSETAAIGAEARRERREMERQKRAAERERRRQQHEEHGQRKQLGVRLSS